MGKSTEEIKKMAKKETTKSPISPIWLSMRRPPLSPLSPPKLPVDEQTWLTGPSCLRQIVLLGFVVFGGIIFEVLSRIFFGGR